MSYAPNGFVKLVELTYDFDTLGGRWRVTDYALPRTELRGFANIDVISTRFSIDVKSAQFSLGFPS